MGGNPSPPPFTHNSKLKKGKSKQSSAKFSWRQSHRKLIVRNQTDKSYLGSGTGRPKQRLLSWVSLAELPVKCTHTHSSLSSGRDKRGWVPPRRIGCLSLNRATYIRKAAAITHRRTYTRNYHRGPSRKKKKSRDVPTWRNPFNSSRRHRRSAECASGEKRRGIRASKLTIDRRLSIKTAGVVVGGTLWKREKKISETT